MKNILLVEDDLFLNDITTKKLSSAGFSVVAVKSTDAAAQKLKEEAVDLVLLDLELPGQPGNEYLLELKSDAETKHLPVIMFSNNDDPNIASFCIQSGAAAFYIKIETDIDDLIGKIHEILD